jgi:hypothetical protein
MRILQTIDTHSGYDFPWSVHNIIPFWGGAEHHDYHHMNRGANYASSFRWLDRTFGIDAFFHGYCKEKGRPVLKQNFSDPLFTTYLFTHVPIKIGPPLSGPPRKSFFQASNMDWVLFV